MPWAVVAIPLAAFLAVLLGKWAYNGFRDYLEKPRLPRSSIGTLPPSAFTLGEHGRQQLRRAIILMTKLSINNGQIPEATTRQWIEDWLESCEADTIDEARLLQDAFLILTRLDTEENIFKMIEEANPELRQDLKAWLNDYLGREE